MNTNISNTTNIALMYKARKSLKGKWGLAIGTEVIVLIIVNIILGLELLIPLLEGLILLVLLPQIFLGQSFFYLSISRNQEAKFGQLFNSFQDGNKFITAIGSCLMVLMFVGTITFLGVFIFAIIPLISVYGLWLGVVSMLSCITCLAYLVILCCTFSMIFYIVADGTRVGSFRAIKKSYNMMKGNKWKYFCLNVRFIGWGLLSILTLGIGFLWLCPYIRVSRVNFYNDIVEKEDIPY